MSVLAIGHGQTDDRQTTERQKNSQADIQTDDRQTEKQTDDRQTEILTNDRQ